MEAGVKMARASRADKLAPASPTGVLEPLARSPDTPSDLSSECDMACPVSAMAGFGGGDLHTGGPWTVHQSSQLYNIPGWGQPYFAAGPGGTLCVTPQGKEGGPSVDLHELVTELRARGFQLPLCVRFPEIVQHRQAALQACFDGAIRRFEYPGAFHGVFPVKCNHDRELLRAVLQGGPPGAPRGGPNHPQRPFSTPYGLEVGSKAELVLGLSLLADAPGALLVCNGYKDAEYMELVLHCRRLGVNAVCVLEQYQELGVMLGVARRMGVRPLLGVRARLATRHEGHWGTTSGERAKFGLRPREIVQVVDELADRDLLGCLQLLHFHIGSQITNIRVVKEAMSEAAYLYAELVQLGAPMGILDAGGGLGVDYEGTNTDEPASISYTIQNYANDVVCAVRDVCIERGIPAPTLVTESGRALGSHHSVLIFDVLTRPPSYGELAPGLEEVEGDFCTDGPVTGRLRRAARTGKAPFLLATFREVLEGLEPTASSLREAYSDAVYFKEEALRAFKLGVVSLEERAAVERLFEVTCARIGEVAANAALPLPGALQPLAAPHAAMYHVNLSIFRSCPDTWAIEQLFPIIPIHRLGEEPAVPATLADLTCDSDGKIDRFVSPRGQSPAPVLPLHALQPGEPYVLAMFLTGVYQEVMGSAHNMFGTTHAAFVRTRPSSGHAPPSAGGLVEAEGGRLLGPGYVIESIVPGETVEEVLGRAQHQGGDLLAAVQRSVGRRAAQGKLGPGEAEELLSCYRSRMRGYTYLQSTP